MAAPLNPAHHKHTALPAFVLLCCLFPTFAWASAPLQFPLPSSKRGLVLKLSLLEDPTGRLTLRDVLSKTHRSKFKASPKPSLSLGYTRSTYWLKFVTHNNTQLPYEWVLELAHRIYFIELFQLRSGRITYRERQGFKFPFTQRKIKYRNVAFALVEGPGQTSTYLFRVHSKASLNIPLLAWSPGQFYKQCTTEYILFGIYFGSIMMLCLLGLLVYFTQRFSAYLYFTLFASTLGISQLCISELSFEYLWASSPWWAHKSVTFFLFIATFFGCVFFRIYFETRHQTPLLDRGLIVCAGLAFFETFASFFLPHSLNILIMGILTAICIALVFSIWLRLRRHKMGSSPFVMLALLVLLTGSALYISRSFGLLESNQITRGSLYFGTFLMVLFFMLGIGEKARDSHTHLLQSAMKKEEAENASKAKTQFLADISHEVRTPLTLILGYSEYLQEELLAESSQHTETLNEILSSSQHLLNLLNHLLDISKIEAGKEELHYDNFDGTSLLRQLTRQLEPLAKTNNNIIKLHQPEPLELLHSDELKLRQILLNIISNACKFTQNGHIDIHISTTTTHLHVRVEDTGVGISQQLKERLFEPFTQATPSETIPTRGTGLGLALSYRYAKLLGGTLQVESVPTKGSTFILNLPLHPPTTKTLT